MLAHSQFGIERTILGKCSSYANYSSCIFFLFKQTILWLTMSSIKRICCALFCKIIYVRLCVCVCVMCACMHLCVCACERMFQNACWCWCQEGIIIWLLLFSLYVCVSFCLFQFLLSLIMRFFQLWSKSFFPSLYYTNLFYGLEPFLKWWHFKLSNYCWLQWT